MVREMLTVRTLFAGRGRQAFQQPQQDSPFLFLQVNEFKPENVASAASRLFMGVKIECAQCHNHPFAPYTKEQFWETAAFFAEVQPAIANVTDVKVKREIKIPDTTKVVPARFFDDGQEPPWDATKSPRETFADWLTSPKNPYFARNMVNRTWAHFLGLGLIEPIDEPSEDNPPVMPELLDDLSKAYIASGYDTRFLIRAITRSKAYQLTSRQTDPSQAEPKQFARMNVKAMTGEQLFDSLATGDRLHRPDAVESAAIQLRCPPRVHHQVRQHREDHREADEHSPGADADERPIRQRPDEPGAQPVSRGRDRRAVPGHQRASRSAVPVDLQPQADACRIGEVRQLRRPRRRQRTTRTRP